MRIAEKIRKTKETDITLKINLDGSGEYKISSPCRFFNHMLEQLSLHSCIDIELSALALDNNFHHLIEDCAIVLGSAIKEALKDNFLLELQWNYLIRHFEPRLFPIQAL